MNNILNTLPIPPQSGCTKLLNQPSNGVISSSGGGSSSCVCPPVKKYNLFYFRYYKENSIAQTKKPFQIISDVLLHVASDDQVRHIYLQFESGQYVYEQIKIAMFASFILDYTYYSCCNIK